MVAFTKGNDDVADDPERHAISPHDGPAAYLGQPHGPSISGWPPEGSLSDFCQIIGGLA